jgi:hypothetical protein
LATFFDAGFFITVLRAFAVFAVVFLAGIWIPSRYRRAADYSPSLRRVQPRKTVFADARKPGLEGGAGARARLSGQ